MIALHQYRHTLILLLSIVLVALLARTAAFGELVATVANFGYVGVLIVGTLFVSTFTVTPAAIVLFRLAGQFDPVWLALVAGAGAMVGDLIIFNFLRDKVYEELKPWFSGLNTSRAAHIFKSRWLAWTLPVLGAVIIASPLPDELGVALMGGSNLNRLQFMVLSYILNTVGIFIIIWLPRAV